MACTRCKDAGFTERDGKLYECVCAYLRRRAAEMPPYIRKAQVCPEHIKLPVVQAADQSLHIISSWADLKAVIKIMMIKYPNKYIKITSDREIRDVYVGATSRAARGYPDREEDDEIFNTLQDLMDLPDLALVRLNEMHYKNKAAPGALEEAISYRIDRDKPTWMFSDIDKPFSTGSHAWSDTVGELLQTAFIKTIIPRIVPRTVQEGSFFMADPLTPNFGMALGPSRPNPNLSDLPLVSTPPPQAQEPERAKEKPERPISAKKIQSVPDDDAPDPLARYGSGVGSPKSFRRND